MQLYFAPDKSNGYAAAFTYFVFIDKVFDDAKYREIKLLVVMICTILCANEPQLHTKASRAPK